MWLAGNASRVPLPRNHKLEASFEVFVTENIATVTKPDRITDNIYSVIQRAAQNGPTLSHLIPYVRHGWPESN